MKGGGWTGSFIQSIPLSRGGWMVSSQREIVRWFKLKKISQNEGDGWCGTVKINKAQNTYVNSQETHNILPCTDHNFYHRSLVCRGIDHRPLHTHCRKCHSSGSHTVYSWDSRSSPHYIRCSKEGEILVCIRTDQCHLHSFRLRSVGHSCILKEGNSLMVATWLKVLWMIKHNYYAMLNYYTTIISAKTNMGTWSNCFTEDACFDFRI